MNHRKDKNWWGRNWKWFVPVGCLGSFVLLAVLMAAIIFFVFGIMKSSDAYKDAVMRAKAYPSIQKALGTPIKEGMFITGSIEVNGLSGQANLSIPVSGPDANGTIYVVAVKSAGKWTFSTLVVEIKHTKQRINVLEQKAEPNKAMDSDKE